MAKVYTIHPGIGIARVGRSEQGFFVAAESMDGSPFELATNGEAPFSGYKDANHVMRRQAARFHVLEYEETPGGLTFSREITANEATIEWTVTLASRKAAGVEMATDRFDPDGADIVTPGTKPRNVAPSGFTRQDLAAEIELEASGRNVVPPDRPMAKFLRKPFYIGEARTDAEGRLVVLPGFGTAATWTTPAAQLVNFLNNPGWHDDIADGSVHAKVRLNGEVDAVAATRAWVLTAPPDFAPEIAAITTLYDVAEHARLGDQIGTVSFTMDVEPIFQRFANYFWLNAAGEEFWTLMREALANRAVMIDNSDENRSQRTPVLELFTEGIKILNDFRPTRRQLACLERWEAGTFIPGDDSSRPAPDLGQVLDRAALTRGVGGGFFPGIEAGVIMREPSLYEQLCRFTTGQFTDYDGVARELTPGLLTERMACPWQADFMECVQAWWPAQRPDVIRFKNQQATQPTQWDRGVRSGPPASHTNRKSMVDHFARLGVIEPMQVEGETVPGETGRDPQL